jgi:hypothetical protein
MNWLGPWPVHGWDEITALMRPGDEQYPRCPVLADGDNHPPGGLWMLREDWDARNRERMEHDA